jgi:hypothetical protein
VSDEEARDALLRAGILAKNRIHHMRFHDRGFRKKRHVTVTFDGGDTMTFSNAEISEMSAEDLIEQLRP